VIETKGMSDFDFACVCDSYSYPFREEKRVARKEHQCTDCSHKIQPGERYWYATGLCEGEWWDGHICWRCEALYDWVKAHIPCLCVSFGNMREELTEICQQASSQAPGLLFGFYRRMLKPHPPSTRNTQR
jgi:hypothetical protein